MVSLQGKRDARLGNSPHNCGLPDFDCNSTVENAQQKHQAAKARNAKGDISNS